MKSLGCSSLSRGKFSPTVDGDSEVSGGWNLTTLCGMETWWRASEGSIPVSPSTVHDE